MPMNRTQQYQWCTMARKCVKTFVVLGLPHFAEYEMEGDVEFIEAARRLEWSYSAPALADKTRTLVGKESKRLTDIATKSLPDGRGKLTADDCQTAFLRFLFLADLMVMGALFACPAFAVSPDWQTVHQWLRGAVRLFESEEGEEPLKEEVWADKQYRHYCKVLR